MAKQHVTIRELIAANRKALTKQRLGAQLKASELPKTGFQTIPCLYTYNPEHKQHRCAIGCVLTGKSIRRIIDRNMNHLPVDELGDIVTFDVPRLAAVIQHVHDYWLIGNEFSAVLNPINGLILPPQLRTWVFRHHRVRIDVNTFAAFLDAVEDMLDVDNLP